MEDKLADLHVVRRKHPLPDEILKMTRNETVCQYCGVSYLIHNEIKLLEEKLTASELEVEKLRYLQKECNELRQELETLTCTITQNQAIIDDLNSDIRSKDVEMSSLKTVILEAEQKVTTMSNELDSYHSQCSHFRSILHHLTEHVKQDKNLLAAVRADISETLTLLADEYSALLLQATDACITAVSDANLQISSETGKSQMLSGEVSKNKEEIRCLQSDIENLQLQLQKQKLTWEETLAVYERQAVNQEMELTAVKKEMGDLRENLIEQKQQFEYEVQKCGISAAES